jgi:hypothetical protein
LSLGAPVRQIAGALQTDQPSTLNVPTSNGTAFPPSAGSSKPSVLASIKVDGSPCAAAIQQHTGADYGSLLSPGNLLLPADRAKEAQPVFERAYAVAGEKDLAAATESIARRMRAEYGAIGRANARARASFRQHSDCIQEHLLIFYE